MRFPLRDVIPSRTRPLVTWTCFAAAAVSWLITAPTVGNGALLLVLHGLPCLVFGETVEDQLGHPRHLALLLVATGLGVTLSDPLAGPLPALAGATMGAHLALFPSSRILLAIWVQVVEIPAFFLMGCWFFTSVLLSLPLAAPALACAVGAVSARLLRLRDRAQWAHFDQIP
jgi:membrane associated rhomboid family serine protease